jgi:hypothetical protein
MTVGLRTGSGSRFQPRYYFGSEPAYRAYTQFAACGKLALPFKPPYRRS